MQAFRRAPGSVTVGGDCIATKGWRWRSTAWRFSARRGSPLLLHTHAAQFAPRGQLAVVDALDAVAERRLDVTDISHQALKAPDLDRGRLIGAPHSAVERDMTLDEAGAQGHRRARRGEAGRGPE